MKDTTAKKTRVYSHRGGANVEWDFVVVIELILRIVDLLSVSTEVRMLARWIPHAPAGADESEETSEILAHNSDWGICGRKGERRVYIANENTYAKVIIRETRKSRNCDYVDRQTGTYHSSRRKLCTHRTKHVIAPLGPRSVRMG